MTTKKGQGRCAHAPEAGAASGIGPRMNFEHNENPGAPEERFKRWDYRNRKLSWEPITWDRIQTLGSSDVDFYWNRVAQLMIVRKPGSETLTHRGRIKGVGAVKLTFLRKELVYPGRFMTPYEIGRLEPQFDAHYVRDSAVQIVAVVRKRVFGEGAHNAQFILTATPFKVAWNAERSFRIIEWFDGEPPVEP